MKKLHLDVDTLAVTTFEADTSAADRAVVAGHAMISGSAFTCRSCPTIVNTCCTPVL